LAEERRPASTNMAAVKRSTEQLLAGLDHVRAAPIGQGRLEMIVRRPALDEREVLEAGELDLDVGLVGDTWPHRRSTRTADGSPHPHMQVTLMNARAVALIAGSRANWPLAGDQLYVDLHLGGEELPPRTQLQIGGAVVEITDQPHRGCAKFTRRFGLDAMRLVNSDAGVRLNLRGINAKVVQPGRIAIGDAVTTVDALVAAD
jgi:MOSC domain-containing protein YiiM